MQQLAIIQAFTAHWAINNKAADMLNYSDLHPVPGTFVKAYLLSESKENKCLKIEMATVLC